MTKDPTEYRAFADGIAHNMNALSEITSRFIGKLDAEQSNYFIETTLNNMWEFRASLRSPTLLRKRWADCCSRTALSRPEWTVTTITGDKIVPGEELHLWGLNANGDPLDII